METLSRIDRVLMSSRTCEFVGTRVCARYVSFLVDPALPSDLWLGAAGVAFAVAHLPGDSTVALADFETNAKDPSVTLAAVCAVGTRARRRWRVDQHLLCDTGTAGGSALTCSCAIGCVGACAKVRCSRLLLRGGCLPMHGPRRSGSRANPSDTDLGAWQ